MWTVRDENTVDTGQESHKTETTLSLAVTTSEQDGDYKDSLNELPFFVTKHTNVTSRVQTDGLALSQTSMRKSSIRRSCFKHESGL